MLSCLHVSTQFFPHCHLNRHTINHYYGKLGKSLELAPIHFSCDIGLVILLWIYCLCLDFLHQLTVTHCSIRISLYEIIFHLCISWRARVLRINTQIQEMAQRLSLSRRVLKNSIERNQYRMEWMRRKRWKNQHSKAIRKYFSFQFVDGKILFTPELRRVPKRSGATIHTVFA